MAVNPSTSTYASADYGRATAVVDVDISATGPNGATSGKAAVVVPGGGGTAGSPSGSIQTVQGVAGGTPQPISLDTAAITNAGTALTPKFAPIAASSSGNNTLVAAVTSKKIRVIALWLTGNGVVNAKFQSGAGGTDLTGLDYQAIAGSGLVLPANPFGWFETAAGALLNLNLSAAVAVGGSLVYIEV